MRTVTMTCLLAATLLAQGAGQAKSLLAKGEFEKAAKAARTVIAKDKGTIEAWLVLADALVGNGQPHEAWTAMEEGLAANPGDPLLTVKLGDVFIKVAEKEQATGGDGTTIRSLYLDAERMYDEALAKDESLAGAWYGKSYANFWLSADAPERKEEARKLLRKCLEVDGKYAKAHALQANMLYGDGNDARRAGNEALALQKFQAAQAKYETALELDTSDPVSFVRYGHCFYAQGKKEEAKDAYLQQLVHHPDDDTAIRSGLYYLADRDWRKSTPFLKEAVEKAPKSGLAWFWYGYSLFVNDRSQEAIEAFRKSDQLKPGSANTLHFLGYAYELSNDASKALDWYRKALAANPDHADAAARFEAIILNNQNDIDRVEKLYEELLKLAPSYGWGFNNYALILRNWCEQRGAANDANPPAEVKRRIRRSGEIYEKAAALLSNEAQVQSDTGLLFEFYPANFDAAKAKAYFTRALDMSDYTCRDAFDGLRRLCRKTGDWETLRDYAEGVIGTIERGNHAVAPVGSGAPRALPGETPGLMARAKAALATTEAELQERPGG